MTAQEFVDAYVSPEHKNDVYTFRQKPCPFLGVDNRCTIYEVRPDCCREYPHTDKEGFVFRTILHANNAKQCPAVFWIVENMRRRARGKGKG